VDEQPLERKRRTQEATRFVLEARVPREADFREGHFPDFPVLPAFVQMQWVARYAREAFGIEVAPCEIRAMKFRAMLHPGDRFRLELDWEPDRERLAFRYRVEGGEVSSGRIAVGAP